MIPVCDKCGDDSVVFIRYSGRHLCERHFNDFFMKRVREAIRDQIKIRGRTKILLAVSGGKDSNVMMLAMHRVLHVNRNVEFLALTIDEGIHGYRESSVPIAEKLAGELGIPHRVVSFKDFYGLTLDEIVKRGKKHPCSYCGVFRRQIMNTVAREWGADYLATGLNLDDMAQSIMMNFTRGDVERLARMSPHVNVQPGFVPRVQPLIRIPETESLLFAMLNGIELHMSECPYAHDALRNEYRALIAPLEEKTPGTRHSILNSYEGIKSCLVETYPPTTLNPCERCGEPTTGRLCRACVFREELGI